MSEQEHDIEEETHEDLGNGNMPVTCCICIPLSLSPTQYQYQPTDVHMNAVAPHVSFASTSTPGVCTILVTASTSPRYAANASGVTPLRYSMGALSVCKLTSVRFNSAPSSFRCFGSLVEVGEGEGGG